MRSVLIGASCALAFGIFCCRDCAARSFEKSAAHQAGDCVALAYDQKKPSSGVFRYLKGSYQGTTFTLPVGRDAMEGMANYPEAVEYGRSTRYVWISSYYRYFSGITLVDVLTRKVIFAAHGRGAELSPDRRRVAYGNDGVYGLLYAVCVNDFVVFPRVRHSEEMISRANGAVEEALVERPQMDFKSGFQWLNDSTIVFVYSENGRAAGLEKNPALEWCYVVKISGVGEGCTTNTIKTSRVRLSSQQRELLNATEKFPDREPQKILAKASGSLTPFTEAQLEPDIFSHPDWPLLPNGEGGISAWHSPDGKHLLKAWFDRHYTETHSGVGVTMNEQAVVTIKEKEDINRAMAPQFVTVGPTSRLLAEPRWVGNNEARLVMQSNWVGEALLDDRSKTKHWLVSIKIGDNTTGPAITKREIPRQEALRLIR